MVPLLLLCTNGRTLQMLRAPPARCRHPVCSESPLAGELVDLRSTLQVLETLPPSVVESASSACEADAAMSAARSALEALAVDERSSLASSPLSVAAARAAAKRALAGGEPRAERLSQLAALAERTLAAERPLSAWAVFEMGAARLSRWRAVGCEERMSRPLLATALRSLAAQRRRHDFERWIGRAEEELGEPLSAESEPLSSAMCAACEAGWEQHALAMNASLADAGRAPSTAALNALMAMRLDASADGDDEQRQRGATSALDVFIRMRVSRVPPPDRDSAALATAAAGRRKETWSGLRNLLRRPWLRVPWNEATGSAAICALVEAGRLRAAAAAAAHVRESGTAANASPLLSLLAFASGPRGCADEARLVYAALEARLDGEGPPRGPPAEARLLLLRREAPAARLPLLLEGARECSGSGDAAALLAAAAVHWASSGEGGRAAALLSWMTREGYDLGHPARAGGQVKAAFAAELSRRSSVEGGGDDVWCLALRSCGRAADVTALADAMEAVAALRPESLQGGGAEEARAVELVASQCATGAISAAAVLVRRLGGAARPIAFVLLVEACCAEDVPSMALARATLGAMSDAGALGAASVGEMARVYSALIQGHGALAQLDRAHAAFEEGNGWLVQAAREADAGEGGDEGSGEEGSAEVRAAEASLVAAMVEAAAPHPDGLLLACSLLEEAVGRGVVTRVDGYYEQLIHGHSTAEELQSALDTLRSSGPTLGRGYRASDATIASLMRALRRRDGGLAEGAGAAREADRSRALGTLRSAGVTLERKMADYLSGGKRLRGPGLDNANDVLAASERGIPAAGADGRRAPSVGMWRLDGAGETVVHSEPPSASAMYDEFESLLALEEPPPRLSDSKPPRDTKRSVGFERLRNAQPGRSSTGRRGEAP